MLKCSSDFSMVAKMGPNVEVVKKADLRQALRCKMNSLKFARLKPNYYQGMVKCNESLFNFYKLIDNFFHFISQHTKLKGQRGQEKPQEPRRLVKIRNKMHECRRQ